MFKNIGLTKSIVLLVWVLDFLFTFLFVFAYSYLVNAPTDRVGVIMGGLLVIRALLFGAATSRHLQPFEILLREHASKRRISAEAVRRADRSLQNAKTRLGPFEAVMWGSQLLIVLAIEQPAGHVGLQTGAELVTVLLALAGSLGSIGICVPLVDWLLTEPMGLNAIFAQEVGIELDRPQRSISVRIVALTICFSACPGVAMSAVGASSHARDLMLQAQMQVDREASEARSRLGNSGGALAAPGSEGAAVSTSVFALDRSGELRSAGAAMPAWLDASWLKRAPRAAIVNAARGGYVRVDAMPDGALVGAYVSVSSMAREFLIAALIVGVTLSIWALIGSWLMSRSVAKPLETANQAVRRIAEKGDLSEMGTLPVAQLDELGGLLVNMNQLVDTMRELAVASKKAGSGNLDVPIEGQGELPDAFRAMLQNLKEGVEQMHGTSAELQSAAAEIFAATQEQEAAATSQSSGMIEIAQTMESLSRSAAHVADSVQGVFQNAERTLENTDQMVARIGTLTGQANRIADILEVIRDIADRSDLLALNGSLEATRAGEAGRGFALVAAEMRRLAERVAGSVADIKALVGEIRESGASTVVATEESKKLAQKTAETARNITLVTQQQRTSTDQVTQSVRGVAEVVTQAAAATMQTRASAEGLRTHADRLTALVQRFQRQA
ncbi:MAG: methyl-accepting chemotaxis protein [Deltaproteobacteria bacterium]|nr:methyl-accepting chemotaxis protein [Deltaproteobacteria bacterium]